MSHMLLTVMPVVAIMAVMIWLYVTSRRSARAIGVIFFSWYGFVSLTNYICQFIFALQDRRHIERLPRGDHDMTVAVQVAGYREDANYFRACLESTRRLEYDLLSRIIVVVDGDNDGDSYMGDICQKVFGGACQVIRLPHLFDPAKPRMVENLMCRYIDPHSHKRVLCILQPHAGKRHAIYTATRISMRCGYDAFLNTDSDTVLDPQCVARMVEVLQAHDDVAAVAGALEIFNAHESLLARMSHARYFHAFNLERAAQSRHGCVQCISGPLGMYRVHVVEAIIDAWLNQTFLGKPCAAGDDRHLTSCILRTGAHVKFTHLAVASTETPTTYVRWLKQQTRWLKSALREGGYSLLHVLHRQSWYASAELAYHTLWPLALMSTIVLMDFEKHTAWSALGLLVATIIIPSARAIGCYSLMERRPDLFYIALYGPLYISSLLPAKLYALATLTDITWGTSVRKAGSVGDGWCDGLVATVLLWNVALVTAFIVQLQTNAGSE